MTPQAGAANLWFHSMQPIDRFLTLDAAQAAAAKEFGLPV